MADTKKVKRVRSMSSGTPKSSGKITRKFNILGSKRAAADAKKSKKRLKTKSY